MDGGVNAMEIFRDVCILEGSNSRNDSLYHFGLPL